MKCNRRFVYCCGRHLQSSLVFSFFTVGENIAKELDIVANRCDIEHTKVNFLIDRGGAIMMKGVDLAEYDSARCFIHTLQRTISESLNVQVKVTTMILLLEDDL